MITVSVVVLPHAEGLPLPARATAGAAGFDLRAAISAPVELRPGARLLVPTGLIFAIPEGWEGQIRPRSGLAIRHGITLINSPGTLDADYRGEVMLPLVNLGDAPFRIERGERLAQVVFARFEVAELSVVDALPDTTRGAGGFGSTGR